MWCTDSKAGKLIISRDVVFDEENMPYNEVSGPETASESLNDPTTSIKVEPHVSNEEEDLVQDVSQAEMEFDYHEESESEYENLENYPLARDREMREIHPPARYNQAELVFYALVVAEEIDYSEPATYAEAMRSKERKQWIQAMKEEIESLLKNKTWVLVKNQKGFKCVSCKWIFKKKIEVTQNNRIRYKARLVARGFTQREGIDFNEVLSLVVKHTSIRVLLALVAQNDMELQQLDVKTAFLHGDLEETIHMYQPEGFVESGNEGKVCLLKKSLYGLKQSPR